MRLIVTIIYIIFCINSNCRSQTTEWRNYGNDPGGQRYARINQITPENINRLKVAWTFRTGEYELYKDDDYLSNRAAFEATPLVIKGTIYFPSPSNQVFALDATDGKKLWQFDPQIDLLNIELSELTCRGVSYWTDGNAERILMGTVDGRLFSIDAKTGKLDTRCGDEGSIDLKIGIGLVQVTSAPAIYEDLVIVGSSIGDNNRANDSKGVVRAYSILTGELVWQFDPIPTNPEDVALGNWRNQSAKRTGAANVWATISVDVENDLVFLPTSSPSPDFYGGERTGNNDYANSVVALRASTGEYLWHFQAVHHDLWDYDIPCQPVLFDFKTPNGSVPAVAIGTKMGHIFVLDRMNGAALLPYEERKVPKSDIPGEVASATQPFPILPKPLSLQNLDKEDAWGPNEEALANARADFESHRYEGIFTPPSFEGTLIAPGNTGGIHWGGMSYDADQNLLITNINRFATQINLFPRHEQNTRITYLDKVRNDNNKSDPETNWMTGTPYTMSRMTYAQVKDSTNVWLMTKPPWGSILAIDLNDGEKLWEKPLGQISKNPEFKSFGAPNLGGTCLTSTGLTFIAATPDNNLRAYASNSGELLWKHKMPASGISTPMTYEIDGKQYVAIAAGGHGKYPLTTKGDFLMVFSLE